MKEGRGKRQETRKRVEEKEWKRKENEEKMGDGRETGAEKRGGQ